MKIGKPVVKAMGRDEPDDISSDCALTGHHIAQGMAEASLPGGLACAPAEPGVYRVRSGVTHMTTITKNSLLTLEAYAKIRKTAQPDFIAHRKLRTVHLGECISVQFEDERRRSGARSRRCCTSRKSSMKPASLRSLRVRQGELRCGARWREREDGM